MAQQGQEAGELEQSLQDLIDTASLIMRLVNELGGLSSDPAIDDTVRRVDVSIRDLVLPILMDQESELECLLESMNLEAYTEWLMSVPPQAMIFAVRKDRFRDCQSQMAEIGH